MCVNVGSRSKLAQPAATWVAARPGVLRSRDVTSAGHTRASTLAHSRYTTMSAGLGVPVKLLHESLGHIVTVELKTGQLYRGKLAEGEPSLFADWPGSFTLITFHRQRRIISISH